MKIYNTGERWLTPEYLDLVIPMMSDILREHKPYGTEEKGYCWEDGRMLIEGVNKTLGRHKEGEFTEMDMKELAGEAFWEDGTACFTISEISQHRDTTGAAAGSSNSSRDQAK